MSIMSKKNSVPSWFPFALIASGLVAIAAGARSGRWKPGSNTNASSAPPQVTQASFP